MSDVASPHSPDTDPDADAASPMSVPSDEVPLSARGVTVGFGSTIVLKDLDLDVYRGKSSASSAAPAPASPC
jgi:phospholipid/cholesterol/gamma-HCH transport system ATP-binding protein